MKENFKSPHGPVTCCAEVPENQYRRVLRKLRTITENLKTTRDYLSDKLYPLTGSLDRGSTIQKPSEIKEVLVPLANELDEIYIELDDINEHINFILNNVEI